MKKRMKNLIENFTYDKRQARRTKKHEEIIQRYERMTSDELEIRISPKCSRCPFWCNFTSHCDGCRKVFFSDSKGISCNCLPKYR